jgi:RimJ/RimL family protein N-acetyltransferase
VTAAPLGPVVDALPSGETPAAVPMEGGVVRLEPLDVARHEQALFESARSDDVWTYLPDGPFATRQDFRDWLETYDRKAGILPFVVVDQAHREARGMASYMNLAPAMGSIEVGYIWYTPAIQRTRLPTESMYLMFRHVFDDLGYRRLEWKCNALNARSKQAARRLGFTYEGTFRQHMIVKGRNRDTAWFSLLDHEWPTVRTAFERWLDADNFDAAGRQRTSLSALTEAARSCR